MKEAGQPTGLLRALKEARSASDGTFRLVRPECLPDRPIAERHRILFYIGHLEAFDANLLRPLLGLPSPAPALDKLFAFGIDPLNGQLPSDRPSDWPSLPHIAGYVRQVRQQLDDALAASTAEPGLSLRLHVALEHRWMHVETLSYMLHQMPAGKKIAPAGQHQSPAPSHPPAAGRMIEIPAGPATLGLAAEDAFGWDNEFAQHTVDVPAFLAGQCKVTNGQFLEFVRDGGYLHRTLWTPADWTWRERAGINHPAFWIPEGDGYQYRGMFEALPLPNNWPVYVSHAEARAYAAWAGQRLLTEPEWHRAAYATPSGERHYPWGDQPPGPQHGYAGAAHFDPRPVTSFPGSQSSWGVRGLIANGWEWTSTLFAPFQGFQPFPFYAGYSAGFFDGQHYVLKGGSPRTERGMLRRSFRNWFQPHYQYAYAGFRCARDA